MFKKLSIAVTVGTVVYFLFGWLVFDLLIGNYTEAHTTQIPGFKKTDEQYSVALLVLSCAAYAALIGFILIALLNNTNLLKGFTVSSVIGVLVAIMADTYWYATSTFYSNATVVILDILAAGITVGVLGLAVTWINKRLA